MIRIPGFLARDLAMPVGVARSVTAWMMGAAVWSLSAGWLVVALIGMLLAPGK